MPAPRSASGCGPWSVTAVMLGRFDGATFVSDLHAVPFGEERVRPATAAEAAAIFETLDASVPTIVLGRHRDHPDLPARIRSKGFSRHTFMCGQSGSGKTYTTGVLFERLLMGSTLDVVVLDPNSDHVMLGSLADPDDTRPEADRFRAGRSSRSSTFRARGHEGDAHAVHRLQRPRRSTCGPSCCASTRSPTSTPSTRCAHDHRCAGRARTRSSTSRRRRRSTITTSALARRIENLRLADWGLWRRDGEVSAAAPGPTASISATAAMVHRGRHRQPRDAERTHGGRRSRSSATAGGCAATATRC